MEGKTTRSRFETCAANLLVYATSSAIDRAVLGSHNSLDRCLRFHVTGEPWNLWDDHNDLRAKRGIREVCLKEERILTLNFFPDRAALRMRSRSAAAI
jgi:hypothetical protein